MVISANIDINEIFATSFYTIDRILEVAWKDGAEAVLLYITYQKHSKIQETNQPWLNDSFMVKALGRGRDKFRRIKHILIDMDLIEIIRKKNIQWKFEDKQYVKVKYYYGECKREMITEAFINQVTENQSDGYTQVTENQSDGLGENVGSEPNLSKWLKLPAVEKSVTNAYSTKYINAYSIKSNGTEVSTANAVSSTPTGFDVDNRKKKNDDSVKLSKTQIKQQAIDNLRHRMEEEGYSNIVVDLIMDFDEVKKWTKLHKQTEKWIKAFITTLNTRDTEQWKIDLLNTAIAWPTQGIWANKYRKTLNQETRPRVNWNMFH